MLNVEPTIVATMTVPQNWSSNKSNLFQERDFLSSYSYKYIFLNASLHSGNELNVSVLKAAGAVTYFYLSHDLKF